MASPPQDLRQLRLPQTLAPRVPPRRFDPGCPSVARRGEAGPTIRCDVCGRDRQPWRCARGTGRCLADAQGHTVAAIVPRVPLRHFTLDLLGVGPALARAGPRVWSEVVRAFVATLFGQLRAGVRRQWGVGGRPRCGAVTVVRRQSAVAAPSLCVHALVLDGGYVGAPGARGTFWPDPGGPDLDAIAADVGGRLRRAWCRGAIAVTHTAVAGPPVSPGGGIAVPGQTQARRRGVVVTSGPRIAAESRADVLSLTRQLTRPAADPCRIRRGPDGGVVYRLPFALADGTHEVALSAHDVAERLAARLGFAARRIRYHGILAAGAGARHRVLPVQLGLGQVPATVLRPPNYARRRPVGVETAKPVAKTNLKADMKAGMKANLKTNMKANLKATAKTAVAARAEPGLDAVAR